MKNITNPCLPLVASRRPFVEILNVDISYRQNLRREGERQRKTDHGGRITKIVDCIRIVFGLAYNTEFITEDDLKAIQAKPLGKRIVCYVTVSDTNWKSRCRTRHIQLGQCIDKQ